MSRNNSGWNRPAANQPTVKKGGYPPAKQPEGAARRGAKAPSKVKGIVAGLVTVCALGGLCLWMFSGGENASQAKPDKGSGRIKEVAPAVTNRPPAQAAKAPSRVAEQWPPPNATKDADGVWRLPGGARPFNPKHREGGMHLSTKSNLPKFDHAVEREIATLITLPPGMPIFGTPNYSKFKQDFINSLADKIEITDEDSERDRKIKEDVIETKKVLAERVKNGEDIVKILKDTREELQRLSQYKREIQSFVTDQLRNSENADSDVEDAIAAANKMLESKGIAPIRSNALLKQRQRILLRDAGRASKPNEKASSANKENGNE